MLKKGSLYSMILGVSVLTMRKKGSDVKCIFKGSLQSFHNRCGDDES